MSNKYNGWTNYATWRINLEVFDGFNLEEYYQLDLASCDLSCVANDIESYAREIVEYSTEGKGLALDYANAFLSEVNWHEIAQSMMDNYAQESEAE